MALTDIALRNAKPEDKPYKLTDEKGLYLLVTPSGGRLWKLKFRNKAGVEKKLSIGAYPNVRLKQARERRDEARRQLSDGIDPAEQNVSTSTRLKSARRIHSMPSPKPTSPKTSGKGSQRRRYRSVSGSLALSSEALATGRSRRYSRLRS